METMIAVFGVIFMACFAQSVTGFGLAIVGMPLLRLLGLPATLSAPLIALIALSMRPMMLFHYWQGFSWRDVWRLGVASIVGIPLGIALLTTLDEHTVSVILGLVLIFYAFYTAFGARWLHLENHIIAEWWAFPLGFLAGILGGAYNIFGPPAIIYANARHWQKTVFKANLQAFALMISVLTSGIHTLAGNITPEVLLLFMIGVPCAMMGMVAGFWLDKHINHATFAHLVNAFLVVMGLSLIV